MGKLWNFCINMLCMFGFLYVLVALIS